MGENFTREKTFVAHTNRRCKWQRSNDYITGVAKLIIYASVRINNIRFCAIIILFGTTCKSNTVRHASYSRSQYYFTMLLHFSIEIKKRIYNFTESSKSRSLAAPVTWGWMSAHE